MGGCARRRFARSVVSARWVARHRVRCRVPFYEFISRDHYLDDAGQSRLDLTFDAGNATGHFQDDRSGVADLTAPPERCRIAHE